MKTDFVQSFLSGSAEGEIEGVLLVPRKIISDSRGSVLHALRCDSEEFCGYGETYISIVLGGIWKEWKRHKEMVQSFVVPLGKIEFLLKDARSESKTNGNWKKFTLSRENYALLQIPPLVWYAFCGLNSGENMIVNTASLPHDPLETEKLSSSLRE